MIFRSSATGPGMAAANSSVGYRPRSTGAANNSFTRPSYSDAALRSAAESDAGQTGTWWLAMPMLSAPAARNACTASPCARSWWCATGSASNISCRPGACAPTA